jgi:hypothetical protein
LTKAADGDIMDISKGKEEKAMKKRNSILRSVICVSILLGVISLTVFSFIPGVCADHDCTGEQCFVCLCVSIQKNLSGVFLIAAGACFVVFALIAFSGRQTPERTDVSIAEQTPVYLKVKLSN